MKTVAFSSIKGGTGKSSLCILLANYATAAGSRVLVIDLDIQNSTTFYYFAGSADLSASDPTDRKNVALAMQTGDLPGNIISVPVNSHDLSLLPSSFSLVNLRAIAERTLKRLLAADLPFDYCFIDCPPTFDNIVLNAVNAAQLIITPAAFSTFDYKGALFYRDQIERDTTNVDAWRLLFNFYRPARTHNPDALRNQYEAAFRSAFGDTIIPASVPETTLIRRYIDTRQHLTRTTQKPQGVTVFEAITELAAYVGISSSPERF